MVHSKENYKFDLGVKKVKGYLFCKQVSLILSHTSSQTMMIILIDNQIKILNLCLTLEH